MIIELKEKQVVIQPMLVPELTNRTYIQYIYETGTDHLLPRLTIGTAVYQGDLIYIDLTKGFPDSVMKVKVELLDGRGQVIHTYESSINLYNYILLGKKPVRPDVEVYIHKLETTIKQMQIQHRLEVEALNTRITNLEEQGEVI